MTARARARRALPTLAAVLAASAGFPTVAALLPEEAGAQVVAGLVAEQVTLSPARGALVSLLRVTGPEDALETVVVTTADGEGAFILQAPGAGTYRVQADAGGLVSPLSPPMELGRDAVVDDLALLVPSRLLLMAYACAAEAPEGSAVVVGLVRDPISGIVLPDAKVTATWRDGSSLLWSEAVSDPAGRYRICGMKPSSGIVRVRGRGPGPAQGGGRRPDAGRPERAAPRPALGNAHPLGGGAPGGDAPPGPGRRRGPVRLPGTPPGQLRAGDPQPGVHRALRARVRPGGAGRLRGTSHRPAGGGGTGALAFEILRRSVPGLRVREIQLEGQPPIVCVETSRRQQSILLDQPCDAVQVVLDGVRIADGVVVVFTRGRGPYTSPLRNRR